MAGTAPHPFSGPVPETIPLDPPPLSLVLVQVRYARVAAVVREDFFAGFQQAVMEEYPFSQKHQETLVSPAGAAAQSSELWRLSDDTEQWRLTLTSDFVTLETSAYPGKEAFYERLRRALQAVAVHVRPPRVERLGVRYVCRLDRGLEQLDNLVRPEIRGVSALSDEGTIADLTITQSSFALEDGHLSARWGIVPGGFTIDPTVPPLAGRSWMLDIDVFDDRKHPFDPDALTDEAFEHSRTQYRFFRWAVEPAFLVKFGADPALVPTLDSE